MPRGMAEQQVWKQNALFLHEGFKGDGPLNVWKLSLSESACQPRKHSVGQNDMLSTKSLVKAGPNRCKHDVAKAVKKSYPSQGNKPGIQVPRVSALHGCKI
eukprot:scaffold641_cov373-Pavlova_lutheri.AAC.3